MAKAKKAATATLTYQGDQEAIDYAGYHLPRGEAVEVDATVAKRFVDHPMFDVSGVSADAPATAVAPEDALEAERAAHAAEIAQMKADFAKQIEANAESLKAGWEEQHAADQAEIARLKALLNNPAPQQPQEGQ